MRKHRSRFPKPWPWTEINEAAQTLGLFVAVIFLAVIGMAL